MDQDEDQAGAELLQQQNASLQQQNASLHQESAALKLKVAELQAADLENAQQAADLFAGGESDDASESQRRNWPQR